MKFRKKPVVIEADQWFKDGDHPAVKRVQKFDCKCSKCGKEGRDHGWVETLEGGHIVCIGDWIIQGVKGEFYPCKPDIFEMTHEPVPEERAL